MRRTLLNQQISPSSMRVPPGTVTLWASATIPPGWLLCDGSGYATTTYPALYAAIGTTYGSTGGFQVPNLKGNVPYGVSAGRALNTTGGASTHTLTAAESALRTHTHTYEDQQNSATYASCNASSGAASTYNQGTYNESTTSDSSNASSSHTNLQPYILLNFIIKT